DKLTIAALEVTLKSYASGAFDEIPTLHMIRLSAEEIGQRARNFCDKLRAILPSDVTLEILPGFSVIGGGSTPDQQLTTQLIAITSQRQSPAHIEARLRQPQNATAGGETTDPLTPVIARIEDDRLILDLRTVFPEEEAELLAAIQSATL
ncbi:MAG: hypothetical protein WA658_19635, partial [Candidatus Acidiferrales bacterium]